MANFPLPVKNTAYILYTGLISQADTKLLKSSPTLAAGDFKVSTDGGAFGNLATLPTVTPAAGTSIKISLSAGEMNGDNVVVTCIDAAGAEWCDQLINIQTATRGIDDLAFPATSGRSLIVDAAGLADANMVKAGPTGAGTAQTARDLGLNLDAAISTIATPAQVKTQVVAALNTDTYAEPAQGVPAATTTLVNKIGHLYKYLRNRVTVTATTINVFNDDAITVDHKSTHSDDGTTYDRGEFTTGP